MNQEKKLLVDTFTTHKEQLKNILEYSLPNPKNSEASEKIRKEGNALFVQNEHDFTLHAEILGLYNHSAALAPSGSPELASAYGNRSAFLFHIEKYEECIQDIDKALNIAKSIKLKVQLLCRKVGCWKNLGIDDCRSIVDEAQCLIDKIDNNDERNQMLKKIDEVTALAVKKVPELEETIQGIDLPVTNNILEKVSIRHNEKYGRFLVAEQNYNPGDIIFVEKLFSISPKPKHHYTNCHHCLKTCYTGIPCDHCDLIIFCSEECSQSSWQEYHHIECSVVRLLNDMADEVDWDGPSLSIKIFINAIKDAGSIDKLKAQLRVVEQCTDVCSRGFYKDDKFSPNTLESFYSLTQMKFPDVEKKVVPVIALVVLIGLHKYSELLNIFHIEKLKDFICNKDLVFLASLFMKFAAIQLNNSFSFIHFMEIEEILKGGPKDARGSCIALLSSLVNNSCCPNAKVCVTEEGKMILYAVAPIKKSFQIFLSYSEEYYAADLNVRKELLKRYNFNCDCQACIESWPTVLANYFWQYNEKIDENEVILRRQCIDVCKAINEHGLSKATFEKLRPKITLAFRDFKQPSTFTSAMQESLNGCITNIFNGLKPQLLDMCKKME